MYQGVGYLIKSIFPMNQGTYILCSNLTEEKSGVSMFEFPTSIHMNTASILKSGVFPMIVWWCASLTDTFIPTVDGVYQHIEFQRFVKATKEEITGLVAHIHIAHSGTCFRFTDPHTQQHARPVLPRMP